MWYTGNKKVWNKWKDRASQTETQATESGGAVSKEMRVRRSYFFIFILCLFQDCCRRHGEVNLAAALATLPALAG